jgi:[acyl-carrier-protein] S-malonyltransferase
MGTVFIFPGQGSQYAGMAGDLPGLNGAAGGVFEQASEIAGLDVLELCLTGEQELITRTDLCQLGVAATSLAWWAMLGEREIQPVAVAGHSLGEYCAAAAAGCIDTRETLELVWARGQAMLEASRANPGGMRAVVGLDLDAVRGLIEEMRESPGVHVANHNASTQVVVAGDKAGLERLAELASQRGARVLPLGVSGPFHTPAMREAQAQVESRIGAMRINDPAVPFFSGYNGREARSGQEVARNLAKGMTSPVRWYELQDQLVRLGADPQVEVGPGQVISRMARRDHPGLRVRHAADLLSEAETQAAAAVAAEKV